MREASESRMATDTDSYAFYFFILFKKASSWGVWKNTHLTIMKRFIKYFMFLFVALATSVSLASCSDDDDEKAPTMGNIVGTWVSVETTTQGSLTITNTITLNFTSNGTGYRKTEEKVSTGAISSNMYTFRYTCAVQSNGTLLVTMIDDDDNYKTEWTITQTGNTLLVGSRIYKRQ